MTPKELERKKGKHIFNIPFWEGHWWSLRCACGRKTWGIPSIYPLSRLPKHTICYSHGFLQEGKSCWACEMKLEPFEEPNPTILL